MKKKLTCMVVILTILIVILIACNSKSIDNSNENTTEPQSTSNEQSTEAIVETNAQKIEELMSKAEELSGKINEANATVAFKEFLEGKRTVMCDNDNLSIVDYLEKYNDYIKQNGIWTENSKVKNIYYSYIDCNDDGTQELALKFDGMDLYDIGDDSNVVCVIKCEDNGELKQIYAFEDRTRLVNTMNEFGYIHYYGSNGATTGEVQESRININGGVDNIFFYVYEYYTELNSGSTIELDMCQDTVIKELIKDYKVQNNQYPQGFQMEYYTLGADKYYCCMDSQYDPPTGGAKQFIEFAKAKGIHIYTNAEMKVMIGNYKSQLNISDSKTKIQEPNWTKLDM